MESVNPQANPASLPTSRTSSELQVCSELDNAGREFLVAYSPDKQVYYYAREHQREAYRGEAPTLGRVRRMFGEAVANIWLSAQLNDLAMYAGIKNESSKNVYNCIAELIKVEYGHLKVTELMMFFMRFKMGLYGQLYGTLNGMIVMNALRQFSRDRLAIVEEYEREEAAVREAARQEAARRDVEALHEQLQRDGMSINDWLIGQCEDSWTLAMLQRIGARQAR